VPPATPDVEGADMFGGLTDPALPAPPSASRPSDRGPHAHASNSGIPTTTAHLRMLLGS
jgi:hypothetical protein